MMPYYEDQSLIINEIQKLEEEKGKDFISKVIGFVCQFFFV